MSRFLNTLNNKNKCFVDFFFFCIFQEIVFYVQFLTSLHVVYISVAPSNGTDDDKGLLRPFRLMPLFSGGTFDKHYNERYKPIGFFVPASAKKVNARLRTDC